MLVELEPLEKKEKKNLNYLNLKYPQPTTLCTNTSILRSKNWPVKQLTTHPSKKKKIAPLSHPPSRTQYAYPKGTTCL